MVVTVDGVSQMCDGETWGGKCWKKKQVLREDKMIQEEKEDDYWTFISVFVFVDATFSHHRPRGRLPLKLIFYLFPSFLLLSIFPIIITVWALLVPVDLLVGEGLCQQEVWMLTPSSGNPPLIMKHPICSRVLFPPVSTFIIFTSVGAAAVWWSACFHITFPHTAVEYYISHSSYMLRP